MKPIRWAFLKVLTVKNVSEELLGYLLNSAPKLREVRLRGRVKPDGRVKPLKIGERSNLQILGIS